MTTETQRACLPFEESRKNLLNDLQAGATNSVVEKKVRFNNDDVPTFLGRLREFEKKSRATVLTIK